MPIRLRLATLRNELNASHQILAQLTGCRPEDLETWEDGERLPSLQEAEQLADSLCVGMDWLFGRTDRGPWSPALLDARLTLRERLLSWQDDAGTPGSRIAHVYSLLARHLPLLSVALFAQWLGLSEGAYRLVACGRQSASATVIARAAWLSGLPERWFRSGKLEDLVFPPLEDWGVVLARLVDEGLTPDDILRHLNVVKALKLQGRG